MGENKGHGIKGPRHDADVDDLTINTASGEIAPGGQQQSSNMHPGQQQDSMQSDQLQGNQQSVQGGQAAEQQQQGNKQSGQQQGSQQRGNS